MRRLIAALIAALLVFPVLIVQEFLFKKLIEQTAEAYSNPRLIHSRGIVLHPKTGSFSNEPIEEMLVQKGIFEWRAYVPQSGGTLCLIFSSLPLRIWQFILISGVAIFLIGSSTKKSRAESRIKAENFPSFVRKTVEIIKKLFAPDTIVMKLPARENYIVYDGNLTETPHLPKLAGHTLEVPIGNNGKLLICRKAYPFDEKEQEFIALTVNQMKLWLEKQELEKIAYADFLTDLPTRRKIPGYLKNHREYSLILIDLDNFKDINDKLGHSEGDRVLKEAAHIIKKSIPSGAEAFRWGGDEFVVLLPKADTELAINVAEALKSSLEKRNIKASFGVAKGNSSNWEQAFEKADKALYKAKRKGKNRVETEEKVLKFLTG